MKVNTAAGLDIGECGLFVEQQDQLGTLMGLVSHRPGRGEAAGLVEKLRRVAVHSVELPAQVA